MSRIGKAPIEVPSGVTVQIDGHKVLVKGPKGQLEKTFRPELDFKQENGKVSVLLVSEDRVARGQQRDGGRPGLRPGRGRNRAGRQAE